MKNLQNGNAEKSGSGSGNGVLSQVFPTRAEWLAARRQHVTGSEIAALLGLHPWKSPYAVWAEKTGRKVGNDDLDSAVLHRGRRLEGLAAEMAAEALPPGTKIERNTVNEYYWHPGLRIGATPDIKAHNEMSLGAVELKSIEAGVYARRWPHGEPPLYVALQVLTAAKLLGAQWAAVGALRVGFACEFDLTPVPLHDGVWARLQDAVGSFWQRVKDDTPPVPDYDRDAALIASLHPISSGTTIDLSRDNALVEALHCREQIKRQLKDLDAKCAAVDALIRDKAGDNEIVLTKDFRVSLKTQSVDEYTVAARTRRPILVKRIREM